MQSNKEKGVALLFALGVMSLVLVTGIAFLANALMKQKIAVNNSSSDQAKLLARSAADRALVALAAFRQAEDRKGFSAAGDARNIYSRIDADLAAAGKHESANSKQFSEEARRATNDQLCDTFKSDGVTIDAASSKLNYLDFHGSDSRAKWIYLHQDGGESSGGRTEGTADDRKIIGRFAYQVLPGTKGGLSLFAATQGAFSEAALGKALYDAGSTKRIPQFHRWGVDGDEINFSDPMNNLYDTKGMFSGWHWTKLGGGWQKPATHSEGISVFKTLYEENAFKPVDNDEKLREIWSEYWFSDGEKRISKEAFPYAAKNDKECKPEDITWLHRFNIAPLKLNPGRSTHPWYARLLGSNEAAASFINSDNAVNRLAQDSPRYEENVLCDNDLDPFGLPYLRRIGNDRGSFENLMLRRKQITANFNDYCDSDSIPTSDKSASTWKGDTLLQINRTLWPSYTGNEKTPYIDSIAFGFKLFFGPLENNSDSATFKLPLLVKSEIIAKLIAMYNIDLLSDGSNYSKVLSKLSRLKLECTARMKSSGKFRYEYPRDGVMHSGIKEWEFLDNASPITVPFTLSYDAGDQDPRNISIEFKNGKQNGYWIASQNLYQSDTAGIFKKTTVEFQSEIEQRIKAQLASYELPSGATFDKLTRIELDDTSIQIYVTNLKFILGGMSLYVYKERDNDLNTDVEIKNHVDFVRWQNGEVSLPYPAETVQLLSSTGGGWVNYNNLNHITETSSAGLFYLGGIEARDARQNLNADQAFFNAAATRAKADWSFVPRYYANGSGDLTAIEPKNAGSVNWTDFAARMISGRKNSVSSPKAPADIDLEECDVENVEEPACIGGTGVSTAVIRNAPMRSPWEIGFIHRAAPWQTINLLVSGNCGGTGTIQMKDHAPVGSSADGEAGWEQPGTTYRMGDAGILDEIKMTEYSKSFGKVNLTYLDDTARESASDPYSTLFSSPKYTYWNGSSYETINSKVKKLNYEVLKALFYGIVIGQTGKEFLAESSLTDFPKNYFSSANTKVLNSQEDITSRVSLATVPGLKDMRLRSQLLKCESNAEAETIRSVFYPDHPVRPELSTNNATQEELIGKTFNLLSAEPSTPNTFQIVVVAQTIKEAAADNVSVMRLDSTNTPRELSCRIGRFDMLVPDPNDPEKNIYFDEITGECRMLVTVEQVSYTDNTTDPGNPKVRNRLRIRQIEYLD